MNINGHFHPARSGLGCGCESGRFAVLSGSESAPESQCQCAASGDENKRQVINDLLMLISIGTALYAIFKKG